MSLATFRALINTYGSMAYEARPPEGGAGFDQEGLNRSFRKRLSDYGLTSEEIEIALDYIITGALKPTIARGR